MVSLRTVVLTLKSSGMDGLVRYVILVLLGMLGAERSWEKHLASEHRIQLQCSTYFAIIVLVV